MKGWREHAARKKVFSVMPKSSQGFGIIHIVNRKLGSDGQKGVGEMIVDDIPLLPFEINRESWVKFPHQVADGIRKGILDGFWKPGDRLPSVRQVKEALGVAMRVAVEALRILAKEGIILLRAKSGAVVRLEPSIQKNHRVLIVLSGGVHVRPFADAAEQLRLRLEDAGYSVRLAALRLVGRKARYDLAQLKGELRQAYELVFCFPARAPVIGVLRESGQPFVLLGDSAVRVPMFVGLIKLSHGEPYAAFVRHCLKRRIRRVQLVSKWKNDAQLLQRALANAGIEAEEWIVNAPIRTPRGEAIERAVFDAFYRRLSRSGKTWFPDVFYFTDDFACYGAMTAMLTCGVRVPDDVRVATSAHCGSIRAFKVSLTRFEWDAARVADMVTETLLSYLRTGIFADDTVIGPVFRTGGSFR